MRAHLVHWLLWPLLAVLLIASGALMYEACGLRMFGLSFGLCPVEGSRPAADIAALSQQVRQLERQLALAPSCAAQLPLTPGGPTDAPASIGVGSAGAQSSALPTVEGAAAPPVAAGQSAAVLSPAASADGKSLPVDAASQAIGAPAAPSEPVADRSGQGPASHRDDGATDEGADQSQAQGQSASDLPEDRAQNSQPTDCPAAEGDRPPVVLALDHSKSMGLPADLADSTVARLDTLIASADAAAARSARQTYDSYVAGGGRKRLDELKDAVRNVVSTADAADRQFGLVTFAGCTAGVEQLGTFLPERHAAMVSAIDQLVPRPATPLAEAINQSVGLARQFGQQGTRVLLVSDGIDTCGGDPCAAAAAAGVPIDVLAVGDPAPLSCIANATGGRILSRSEDETFEMAMSQALAPLQGGGC